MALSQSQLKVLERKLRPIYDQMDANDYKGAQQNIDKLMKKFVNNPYLLVLKALTLIKLNRTIEADGIITKARPHCLGDEQCLQTIALCYRDIGQYDKIVEVYEEAVKHNPANEAISVLLFLSYVRMEDFKKQKMLALNMHKLWPRTKYYAWAITCTFLEAISAEDKTISMKVTLPLAEKMCQKMIDTNKFDLPSELELYLAILEKQNNSAEILKVLENETIKMKSPDYLGFYQHKKSKALKALKKYSEAYDCLIELIDKRNDQYEYYIDAFHVVSEWDKSVGADSLTHISKLFDKIESTVAEQPLLRGPLMAKIVVSLFTIRSYQRELLNKQFVSFANEDMLVDLLSLFFVKFAHKFACIKDMIFMLKTLELSKEQHDKLLAQVGTFAMTVHEPRTPSEAFRVVTYQYLVHYLSTEMLPVEKRLESVQSLYKLNQIVTFPMENQPVDVGAFNPIVHLVINKLFVGLDMSKLPKEVDDHFLFTVIGLLEWSRHASREDPYIKLMLVRLYNIIGAAKASHQFYETLDVKFIQFDTLGYFFLEPFLTNGTHSIARSFLENSWRFYCINHREIAEHICTAFKGMTYSKVVDIHGLNQKLKYSCQYLHILLEKHLFEVIDCENNNMFNMMIQRWYSTIIRLKVDVIDWNKVYDNRDISLLNSHNHSVQPMIEDSIKKATHADDIMWLGYRFALFQLMTMLSLQAIDYVADKAVQIDNFATCAEYVAKIKEKFELLPELSKVNKQTYPLEAPQPSRLYSYFAKSAGKTIGLLLEGCYNIIHAIRMDKEITVDLAPLNTIDLAEGLVPIEDLDYSSLYLPIMKKVFGTLSDLLEIVSIDIVLLEMISNVIAKAVKKPVKSKKVVGNQISREKALGNLSVVFIEFKDRLAVFIDRMLSFVQTRITGFGDEAEAVVLEARQQFAALGLPEELGSSTHTKVKSSILESYQISYSTLNSVLVAKAQYLSRVHFPN